MPRASKQSGAEPATCVANATQGPASSLPAAMRPPGESPVEKTTRVSGVLSIRVPSVSVYVMGCEAVAESDRSMTPTTVGEKGLKCGGIVEVYPWRPRPQPPTRVAMGGDEREVGEAGPRSGARPTCRQ